MTLSQKIFFIFWLKIVYKSKKSCIIHSKVQTSVHYNVRMKYAGGEQKKVFEQKAAVKI